MPSRGIRERARNREALESLSAYCEANGLGSWMTLRDRDPLERAVRRLLDDLASTR
jgi:hypothetical protein